MPSTQVVTASVFGLCVGLWGLKQALSEEKMKWDREAEKKATEKRCQEWEDRRKSQNLKGKTMTPEVDLTKSDFFRQKVSLYTPERYSVFENLFSVYQVMTLLSSLEEVHIHSNRSN